MAHRSRHTWRWIGHAAVLTALGTAGAFCAPSLGPGAGFDVNFPDNRPADVGAVAQSIANRPAERGEAYVVLTAPPPARGLTAFALPDGRRLWQVGGRIDARPWAAGDVVVTHADSQVMGLDARTGRERFRVNDEGYALIGAGGDENHVAISLGPGGLNRRRGRFVVVNASTGAQVFAKDVEQSLGVPTAAAGYAFVPWNAQYLSIFDLGRGEERARIRATDDIFARVEREGAGVYFGGRVLYRLAAESARGRREGAQVFVMPRQDLPGNPPLMSDGYAPAYAGVNARERVAVVMRPDPAAPGAGMVDGAVYALFHRVLFALDAASGQVRWAYVHGADIAGAEPVRGGVVLVDDRGAVTHVDARGGNPTWRAQLGAGAAQAVLHVPLDFASPGGAGAEPAQPATTTLIAAAGGTDDRMLPARMFAAQALATMPGPEATRGLLDIASRRNYPAPLRAAAGEALARRTEGIDALIDALATHTDYIRGTVAPPVGYIARAIATARERRGVPGLIAHLQDPHTPAADLPPLVSALRDLADASAVPTLLDFVRLHHADDGPVPPVSGGDPINDRSLPEQDAVNAALELAVQAALRLGGPTERRWIQFLQGDPNTLPPVRVAMERALAPAESGSAQADRSGGGDGASGGGGGADANGSMPGVIPPRVTREMMQEAFAPVRERMLRCLDGAPSRPSQLRLTFRYDNTGAISNLSVTPAQWTPCIAPIAATVRLPESQVAREIGTYYVLGETP